MLLSEQVRQLANESNLLNDSAEYTVNNPAWATCKDYGNITAPTGGRIVLIRFQYRTLNTEAQVRLKVGGTYAFGKSVPSTAYNWLSVALWLGAGSHNILVEGKTDGGGGSGLRICNMQAGITVFTDKAYSALAAYSSHVDLTITSRTTPLGNLNKAVFLVTCFAYTPSAQTNFENPGDNLTNGVSLSVDDSQITWTERSQDPNAHERASAKYYAVLSVGVQHSFVITKDNANTVVNISIIASPWVLGPDLHEPITLDFSQGSTVYVLTEPFDQDSTKHVYLGKKRAISIGDSTDYYASSTGTGLLSFSYTFEIVAVEAVFLLLKGQYACVGAIAVDLR